MGEDIDYSSVQIDSPWGNEHFSLVEDGQILGWKQRTKESNLESFAVGNEG